MGKESENLDKDMFHKKRKKPNILSRIFLCWVCPVIIKGNKRDVEEDDLVVPSKVFDSNRQGEKLERKWLYELERAEREKRKPSLWSALWRAYWWEFMPGAFYVAATTIARTAQPVLFANLLSYWSVDSDMDRFDAGMYALAMLGLNFLAMMCQHHNSLFVMSFSLKIKVACSAILYRKLLRVNQVAVSEVAGGKLVNLLSNDVARFDYAFMFLHHLWIIPIQTAVVLYFLYNVGGYAPFVGLFGVTLLIFPIQAGLTKITAVVRRQVAQRTDRRIKLMNEIISGIQVIKMYAWEKPFQLVVKAVRAYEMSALKKSIFIRSVFLGFMLFTDRSIMFFTILTFVLTNWMVSATTIYPIQQFLGTIQFNLTMILPLAIASLSELKVALDRIQSFLELDERDDIAIANVSNGAANRTTFNSNKKTEDATVTAKKYSSVLSPDMVPTVDKSNKPSEFAVELSGVTASWTGAEADHATLKNISLRIRRGKLFAIIGPVGSGKTSLLQLLIKELPAQMGSVAVNGTVSYSCQESWLFPATVRENILFGQPYDVAKYKEVCRVCCLAADFKQFPYGDLSLVGERGVSLSGGQRARITLARAVYRSADIYLLDDPLSAVDANVGRLLFDECIRSHLRDRTCILVTHQIHYLKDADFIVVMNEGSIEDMGTYDELVKSGKDFSSLLSGLQDAGEEDKEQKRPSLLRGVSIKSNETEGDEKEQVQQAEERAQGNLKWSVVAAYLSSVKSYPILLLTVLVLLLTQAAATFTDYWLSLWTNAVDEYVQGLPEGVEPEPGLGTDLGWLTNGQYLLIYGCVILGLIILVHLRILNFVIATMRASQNIHNKVFNNLIMATKRFFDTNPSGRVLNRFSKDLGAIDEMLPRSMLETLQMYLSMTSALVLNALALPWTLIPTAILVFIFIFLLRWYLQAAQAVKRLEGTTKSPVFGMINSTISGLSTIRSSDAQPRLKKTFDKAQNLHSSAFYTFIGGSSAFGLYLDALCLVYLGFIIGLFIIIDFGELIPVGSVGLAVSQSMMLTILLQMAARFTTDFLAQLTSVERTLEYSKLPSEPNMEEGPTKPPPQWPTSGEVNFENVSMKYGPEDPYVLKNLNVRIQSGWKVGVVGRTGAGKSSLISALFRLTDIEGKILIDGIDTCGIAKKELRTKISIIPQEPILFSATVRYNLDPFNNYSDDELWKALEQVELKETISSLDLKVTEAGSNFSMGQRQLMCLARAILRSNKILVMDEATANVDPQTDGLIQKTIRQGFASCTVITIAHRLITIMDSDRVLVMDQGEVVEFDCPYNLLMNPDSHLNFLVKETNDTMSKLFFDIAKTKYFSDNPQL